MQHGLDMVLQSQVSSTAVQCFLCLWHVAKHALQVLRREYAKGVDVVYESVGGDMFKTAVDALAMRGRLLVIGMMSQYGDGWPVDNHPGLPEKLLKKSASLIGALVLWLCFSVACYLYECLPF